MSKIKRYRRLIKEHRDKISDLEEIVRSLEESLVREIKTVEIPYSSKMLYKAWGGRDDENDMRSFIWEDLLERLFPEKERKNVSFNGIIASGYDGYAYLFQFSFKGISFELAIPDVKKATVENYAHMRYGMYLLSHEKSSSYWVSITESYDLDDISKAIMDFVKEGDK